MKLTRVYLNIFAMAIAALLFSSSACKNNQGEDAAVSMSDSIGDKKENARQAEDYTFNPEKPYPYPSGTVEYKYTGDYDGKQVIYFTDFGRTFRLEDDYVNLKDPVAAKVKRVFIGTPDKLYFYSETDKKGYVIDRKKAGPQAQGNMLPDIISYGIDSAMRRNGYQPAGSLEVSGKQCQVYKSADGKSQYCFWKGMNIKTDMRLGEQFSYTLEAVSIDEKANIGPDKFEPAQGVEIMSYDAYIKSEGIDKL